MDTVKVINQPMAETFGDALLAEIEDTRYKDFYILSAFAKNSGVLRLLPAFRRFRQRGGTITVFIGIDMKVTTEEAVKALFENVDNLYVVHATNNVTFHAKTYVLQGEDSGWIGLGSNNITAGGLWHNFESSLILKTTSLKSSSLFDTFDSEIKYLDALRSNTHNVMLIKSEEDLQSLLKTGLLSTETESILSTTKHSRNKTEKQLFGSVRKSQLPKIEKQSNEPANDLNSISGALDNTFIDTDVVWFETRALTGGSSNILDLSKTGSILRGSATGTCLDMDSDDTMLGGVAFFDIDPNGTEEKDITIAYQGDKYFGNTIKFAPDNGSWRMQIKGTNQKGEKLHQKSGQGWLRYKILVFEKISSTEYALYVSEESEKSNYIEASLVYASNGSAKDSKQYGIIARETSL